jgi:hypothetical protein
MEIPKHLLKLCHPELDSGSPLLSIQTLKQVQGDKVCTFPFREIRAYPRHSRFHTPELRKPYHPGMRLFCICPPN